MRPDMDKVLCENARVGHRSCFGEWRFNKKFAPQYEGEGFDLENAGHTRESMKQRYHVGWSTKELNENLGPLRRFLENACGRKWDDVYSEICSTFSMNTTVEQHILIHVDHFVNKDTCMRTVDGEQRVFTRGYGGKLYPVDESCWFELYVHPITGVLTKSLQTDTYRQRRKRDAAQKQVKGCLQINQTRFLIAYEGVWYEVDYAPQRKMYFQQTVRSNKFAYGTNKNLATENIIVDSVTWKYTSDAFGKPAICKDGQLIAVSKRQLNHRQLKKYNLAEHGLA